MAATALAVIVAVQVVSRSDDTAMSARADVPTVQPGVDVLQGVGVVPATNPGNDYRRAAFRSAWDDDNRNTRGHNGCDAKRHLNRDLVDKTYVAIEAMSGCGGEWHLRPVHQRHHRVRPGKSGGRLCPDRSHNPAGLRVGHGARNWTDAMRVRFANDPANLLAVSGQANQDKSDQGPVAWMPPNHAFWCQYAMQFIAVARGYELPLDEGRPRNCGGRPPPARRAEQPLRRRGP